MGIFIHQDTDSGFAQAAQAGNAWELVKGGRDADIRVQAGPRRGDQVDRDELCVRWDRQPSKRQYGP